MTDCSGIIPIRDSHGITPMEECVHGLELSSVEMGWEGFQGLHSSGFGWRTGRWLKDGEKQV